MWRTSSTVRTSTLRRTSPCGRCHGSVSVTYLLVTKRAWAARRVEGEG